MIAICFFVPCFMYAVVCPLIFLLTNRLPKRLVLFLGLLVLGISQFLIGKRDVETILTGLVLVGIAAPMVSIPLLPEAIESTETTGYYNDEANKLTSSFFMSFMGVGEALGPITSSLLMKKTGFEASQKFYGMFILLFLSVYFVCCGHFRVFRWEDPQEHLISSEVSSNSGSEKTGREMKLESKHLQQNIELI